MWLPPLISMDRWGRSALSRWTSAYRSGGIVRFSLGDRPDNQAFRAWTEKRSAPASGSRVMSRSSMLTHPESGREIPAITCSSVALQESLQREEYDLLMKLMRNLMQENNEASRAPMRRPAGHPGSIESAAR